PEARDRRWLVLGPWRGTGSVAIPGGGPRAPGFVLTFATSLGCTQGLASPPGRVHEVAAHQPAAAPELLELPLGDRERRAGQAVRDPPARAGDRRGPHAAGVGRRNRGRERRADRLGRGGRRGRGVRDGGAVPAAARDPRALPRPGMPRRRR